MVQIVQIVQFFKWVRHYLAFKLCWMVQIGLIGSNVFNGLKGIGD